MSSSYTVKDGDHLSKIAKKFGFRSFLTVWDDPGNAALRQLRPNPNVLLPGDVVFIPDKERRDEAAETGKRHVFFTMSPRLKLRIVIKDRFDSPIASEPGQLDVDGDERPVTTASDGLIERAIPVDAEGGSLEILGVEPALGIGRMHPADDSTGWQARLNNLGYHAGEIGKAAPEDVRSAVEEFQCDFGLPVVGLQEDGTLDGATRQKLLEVHGC
jgi:hypothetical protein